MSVETISLHTLTLKRRNSEEMDGHLGRKKRSMGQSKDDVTATKSKDAAKNEKMFTQAEVNALLHKQEHTFRILLENKLKEQYNAFNKLYIEHIFKENTREEISYIS